MLAYNANINALFFFCVHKIGVCRATCSLYGLTWYLYMDLLKLGFLALLLREGNGTPLQYSCLEDPMDGGAWWAAVHGVAGSRTRLRRRGSSSPLLLSAVLSTLMRT